MRRIVVPVIFGALRLCLGETGKTGGGRTLLAANETSTSAEGLLLPEVSLTEMKENDARWTNETIIHVEQRETMENDRRLKKKGKKARKPNILIIMTDQQRFDGLQFVQEEMKDYNGKFKVRTS
jgi:hypothetical protein